MAKEKTQGLGWVLIGVVVLGVFAAGASNAYFSIPDYPVSPPQPQTPKSSLEHMPQSYVREYLKPRLRDWDSVKAFDAHETGLHEMTWGNTTYKGTVIWYQFNAKNAFGAYTGIQEGWIVVKNEQVIFATPFN